MLDILDRQTLLTGNQLKIAAAAVLGDMLEFFDYYLIGYVLAFIVKPWDLTFGQSALILLSSGIGAISGAYAWGYVADRIGRRADRKNRASPPPVLDSGAVAPPRIAARMGQFLPKSCHKGMTRSCTVSTGPVSAHGFSSASPLFPHRAQLGARRRSGTGRRAASALCAARLRQARDRRHRD
ncbi:MAG TPA: hypothetical protein VEI03_14070 [Stellaceae bacterium]|nr:hypothetical protein [Stellaceae bacterium]